MSSVETKWLSVTETVAREWIAADPVTLEGYQVLFEAVERQGLARNWQW